MSMHRIALYKTVSWRFVASFTTFIITWIVTGNIAAGLTVGGVEAIAKMFLYYGHERAWSRYTVETIQTEGGE